MFSGKYSLRWIALGLFGLVLGLSLLFYFTQENRLSRVVLFFPAEKTFQIVGEDRAIFLSGNLEKDLTAVASETLLGPARPTNLRLFPNGGWVRSLLVRQDKVYLDLSKEIVMPEKTLVLDLKSALEVLKKNLHFNFPGLKPIIITINGVEPVFLSKKAE